MDQAREGERAAQADGPAAKPSCGQPLHRRTAKDGRKPEGNEEGKGPEAALDVRPTPGVPPGIGIDVKGVRRPTAALVLPYRTGSHDRAMRTASNPMLLRRAAHLLRGRIYAESTKGPRKSRLRTVRKLLKAAGHRYLPITTPAMTAFVSSLVSGGHRSVANYLGDWRKEHAIAGHAWTDALSSCRKDLLRAATRGQGPPRRAEVFGAERLPRVPSDSQSPVVRAGPRWPWLMLCVGVCWILRGAEVADLLGEQAAVDAGTKEATLSLRATKMDAAGAGCQRTLECICATSLRGPCPFCSLALLLEARKRAGLGGKDPLFPDRQGRAASRRTVVQTLRRLLKVMATEHTMRREGSQLLARRGVLLYLIQFLGRWGGSTVERYVAEALRGQLARASSACAAGGGLAPAPESVTNLQRTLKQLVDEAVAARCPQQAAPMHVLLSAAASVPGAPRAPPVQKIRGLKGQREAGEVHDAVVMDQALPREAWATRCNWKFGCAAHVIVNDQDVTCARCIARRAVEARTGMDERVLSTA